MFLRKPDFWWDFSWSPVSGCRPISAGCRNCWVPRWLNSHTWQTPTVYDNTTKVTKDGRRAWSGNLTALRDGDPVWTLPLTHPGVANPALGPGQPNLIFAVMNGDLFVAGRPREDIDRVCMTLAVSPHLGLLVTKYTRQMTAYLAALEPRTARRWQAKHWLGFSAEDQRWFDRRWEDLRPFAEAGWRTFVSISPMLAPVVLPPDFLALDTWVIVNGECEQISRDHCRPMEADWARALRRQCRAAGIPFFMRAMHTGAHVSPDLHVREFPSVP